MTVGSYLPPFLTTNPIYEGDRIMAESIVAQPRRITQRKRRIKVEPGEKYGRLTIVKEVSPYVLPSGKSPSRRFECLCECGETTLVKLSHLRTNRIKSCGCLSVDRLVERVTQHGLSKHPLYFVWASLVNRCTNPEHPCYHHYGGRGITVCKEWRENIGKFIDWAVKNGWKEGLCIDKINNNKGYFPGNVRFVDDGLSRRNQCVIRVNNTSGYSGVSMDKRDGVWVAYITANSVHNYLGRFKTALEAAKARDRKARELNMGHPLNFLHEEVLL